MIGTLPPFKNQKRCAPVRDSRRSLPHLPATPNAVEVGQRELERLGFAVGSRNGHDTRRLFRRLHRRERRSEFLSALDDPHDRRAHRHPRRLRLGLSARRGSARRFCRRSSRSSALATSPLCRFISGKNIAGQDSTAPCSPLDSNYGAGEPRGYDRIVISVPR